MLKFIRGKGSQPSLERQKLQRELFAFRKTVQHGFPNKPSAVAWDPLLRLMAIGTSVGAIKVFGRPGVEFYGQHINANADIAITQLLFLPGTGKLVSLCDDNSLHLWEMISNESALVEIQNQALEGKLKKISTICAESSGEHLLLGTEGGNIYLLDLNTFNMAENIIYQDVVMQNCPEDYKLNPGAVECISEHPNDSHLLLIGYNRGLIVVWDRRNNRARNTFVSNQQLESVCWHENGTEFTSSHNDGSYMSWDLSISREKPLKEPSAPYGPYPCKAITKLLQRTTADKKNITIFSGGMQRSSHADKYTVTVIQGDKHVVFDFTSRVIDFFTTTPVPPEEPSEDVVDSARPLTAGEILPQTVQQEASTLIVVADEEMVAIDLTDSNWKMIKLPYLVSLHASAVTCTQYISYVDEEVYDNIVTAGENQTSNLYSSAEWPVTGGNLLCAKPANPEDSQRQILLTGHEDGTVRFWDASGVTLNPLYKFVTSNLFSGDDIMDDAIESPISGDDEEDWPPFKKIGVFDPYSDDPRLAVKKIALCPLSGTLVVAGTAGHVVTATIGMDQVSRDVNHVPLNIVSDRDGFIWKGHDQLNLRHGPITMTPGFQVNSVLQILPPAAITCCSLQAEWGLITAGTAHGLALFDYKRNVSVMHKCTLNPNDLNGSGDTPISRRKSFKKSLRESFRRLRKGRSQRRQATPVQGSETDKKSSPQTVPKKSETGESLSPLDAKPIERQIEARPVDDSNGSMVRCLHFAKSYLTNTQKTESTLWAGTNNGTVYAFAIAVPPATVRQANDVTCQLAKEIQLKHRAPVIGIAVLDGASVPLPEPFEVEKGVSPLPDITQPHRVIIASEEQFKIFSLPSLKPYGKYKLTAHEGARVRRMAFGNFLCMLSENGKTVKHLECCLLCLTNLGDCLILSVPDLRRQLNAAAVRKEDINGISSLTFSKYGEALYLHSSSELQRITVSTNKVTRARCYLLLPLWAQPTEISIDTSEIRSSPLLNGEHKSGDLQENGSADEIAHNVTTSSQSIGDITVDSVKDHLIQIANHQKDPNHSDSFSNALGTINLQTSSVNQSSVIVKTTTLTTLNNSANGPPTGTTEANTTTSSHHSTSTTTDNNAAKKGLFEKKNDAFKVNCNTCYI
ncbi:LLGL domain-containing protein l(2)gl isoform X2 [Arctopsyche grandis]|uniref:LLGL domain-containing protein l(2)gl isoform X2 n=1 Tax=Arctopsyche grandis TaxID=121162 RepID=UPI00406D71F1